MTDRGGSERPGAGPAQGNTNYCWAASVVAGGLALKYSLGSLLGEQALAAEVERFARGSGLAADGTGGINKVVEFARHLGMEAEARYCREDLRMKALLSMRFVPIVKWNPASINFRWYSGLHMGALIRWEDEVWVTDSCEDPNACRSSTVRRFVSVPGWYSPKIALLS